MYERIEVVYENGVLRPVGNLPLALHEHQRLTISVEAPETGDDWLADADPAVSLQAVREALSKSPRTLAQMVHEERDER
jgi:predicted DNA-binding antitoxin AbrB/MazE fold protein